MTKIAHTINSIIIFLSILSLTILSFFEEGDQTNLIPNIIFLVFICIFIACSSKLSMESLIISVAVLVYYLRDFYNGFNDPGFFTNNASGLYLLIAFAVTLMSILPQFYLLFMWPNWKIKLKALLFIILLAASSCLFAFGIFTVFEVFETMGFIKYIIQIVINILFVLIASFAHKFAIIDILEK